MIHELKCWPEFYGQVIAGNKTHELRKTDRDFNIGDQILLKEFDPILDTYSSREQLLEITYITRNVDLPCALSTNALNPEYCILSIKLCS